MRSVANRLDVSRSEGSATPDRRSRSYCDRPLSHIVPQARESPQVPRSPLVVLGVLLLVAPAGGPAGSPPCQAIVVAQARVSYPHTRSLQAAIERARPCDWILVEPGVYPGPLTIRVPDLHLRGLNRNRVVVDGGHRVGNGITVEADGVSIENLTARNFDRRSRNDDSTGTQVLWRGVRGWRGRYLTAYDDGLLGGYGLWASGAVEGSLDHVYASGFDDSGLYVGACRNCRARVEDALAEHNLVGLAATNASGHFVVEHSVFRENAVGASFNSSQSDPPPPQLGTCDAGANRSPAPSLGTTRLARCTIFRDNRVIDNNALDVPSNTASVRPGAGIGIDLLGSYGDLIAGNRIAGNRNVGVLGLQLPLAGPVRFALAGNRISGNRISGSRLAIALAGGGRSLDNCVQGNRGRPTEPKDLRPYSCAHASTLALPARSSRRVRGLVHRLQTRLAAQTRRRQPAPPPQPSMPDPCRGAPPNPLCRR